MVLPGVGFCPAPAMATIQDIKIDMTAGILNHERPKLSVRGKLRSSVGMAKIPVYHIRQSLLSERAPSAI